MNDKAFIFSGMALLLAIPTIILAASFTSMLSTGTTGVATHLRADKVFVLFELTETDLGRAAEISGRRAAVSALGYQRSWNESLDLTYSSASYGAGACGAIKEMVLAGTLAGANHFYDASSMMTNNTLNDWKNGLEGSADQNGFNLTLETPNVGNIECECVNDSYFYLRFLLEGEATDETGNFVYNGSFPRYGKASALISAAGTNEILFIDCENELPTPIISSPSDGSSFLEGDPVTFNGSLSNDTDNDLPLTFEWRSNVKGFLSSSSVYTDSTLATGTHTITLTVTDTKGGVNSTSIEITIIDVGGGISISLSPINDTYIDEALPDTNFGSVDELKLKRWASVKRTLLLFNLSSVDGATINSALLKLYIKNDSGPDNNEIKVHRITSSWGESTATWNNANSIYDVTELATNQTQPISITFNVTASVQDFADGTANYGWLIKYLAEIGNKELTFYSKEEVDPGYHPVLTVNYTP
jgi:hypothetical protein